MGKKNLNLRRFLEDQGVSLFDFYKVARDYPPVSSIGERSRAIHPDKPAYWIWDSIAVPRLWDELVPGSELTWMHLDDKWTKLSIKERYRPVMGMRLILEPGELPDDDLALALWVAEMERDYKEYDDEVGS